MSEYGQTGRDRGDLHWSTERMSSIGDTLRTAAHRGGRTQKVLPERKSNDTLNELVFQ